MILLPAEGGSCERCAPQSFFANRCWLLLIPGRWYVTCLKGDVRFSRNMCNCQRRRVLVKDLPNCKKVSILLDRLGGHGN